MLYLGEKFKEENACALGEVIRALIRPSQPHGSPYLRITGSGRENDVGGTPVLDLSDLRKQVRN